MYCYNKEFLNSGKEFSVQEVLKRVEKDDIVLIGGGEPMLYKDLDVLLKKLYEVASLVVVSTNATIYREVPNSNKLIIQLSLPTLDKKKYEEVTGYRGNFERILENIRKYVQKYNCVINVPLANFNLYEMKKLAKFADELGIPIRFRKVVGMELNENEAKRLYIEILSEVKVEVELVLNERGLENLEYYSPFRPSGKHPFLLWSK